MLTDSATSPSVPRRMTGQRHTAKVKVFRSKNPTKRKSVAMSIDFGFMLYALAGFYTKHNLKKNNLKKKTSTQQNLNLVALF